MKHAKRHPLIFGTIILTATGLITRVIGFFYRIYLSRLFGEEGMGIYQLLSPALSLSFSLTAAGYQTAISKYVAADSAKRPSGNLKPLLAGISITLPLSLVTNAILFFSADPIGIFLLKDHRTVPMLRILSFSVPFAALHACIIGGDGCSASIAAASILAKVSRDRYVTDVLDPMYPQYGFAKHKGYGTRDHYAMLDQYGPCPEHRMTFLKKWKEGKQ